MDRLESMQIFARVVEMHSFGRAAESLSLPPSRVTRAVKELEAFLGVRLLQRTTRHISLTADGTLYYDDCRRLLAEIEAVESGFPGSAGRPRGRLRVDMTLSLARLVVLPSIKDFQSRFPDVELTLTVSDRTVELVQEEIDCVIRAGTPEDSPTLVAKRIGAFHWVTCASPEYLALHGTPKSLEDLADHHAVGYLSSRTARTVEWHFVVNSESRSIRMRERLIVNDTDAYVASALEGLGLIARGQLHGASASHQWPPAACACRLSVSRRSAVCPVSEEPSPFAHRASVRGLGWGSCARGSSGLASRPVAWLADVPPNT